MVATLSICKETRREKSRIVCKNFITHTIKYTYKVQWKATGLKSKKKEYYSEWRCECEKNYFVTIPPQKLCTCTDFDSPVLPLKFIELPKDWEAPELPNIFPLIFIQNLVLPIRVLQVCHYIILMNILGFLWKLHTYSNDLKEKKDDKVCVNLMVGHLTQLLYRCAHPPWNKRLPMLPTP